MIYLNKISYSTNVNLFSQKFLRFQLLSWEIRGNNKKALINNKKKMISDKIFLNLFGNF